MKSLSGLDALYICVDKIAAVPRTAAAAERFCGAAILFAVLVLDMTVKELGPSTHACR